MKSLPRLTSRMPTVPRSGKVERPAGRPGRRPRAHRPAGPSPRRLLLDDPGKPGLREPDREECKKAFAAIIEEEAHSLSEVGELLRDLKERVAAL